MVWELLEYQKEDLRFIHTEEPLSGEVYLKMMATFRACYRSASWEQTEMIADEYINTSQETNPQLKAAVLIEKGYSFSCRGQLFRVWIKPGLLPIKYQETTAHSYLAYQGYYVPICRRGG